MITHRVAIAMVLIAGLTPTVSRAQDPHAGHVMPMPANQSPTKPTGQDAPKEPIPPLTDADRAAAFPPDLVGHAVHDRTIRTFVLFDQLEWQGANDGGPSLENKSWIGGDLNRVWLRVEADSENRRLESSQAHLMYGRSFSRWWDVVAGVRQDYRPGPAQTWAAFGIQGLAPYWFDIAATGYVGADWRTHARFEAEYDLLFTNRLVLQPAFETEIYGKSDPEHGFGAGLAFVEPGFRMRYEFRREFAPYVGVTWRRKLFGTADLAKDTGESVSAARVTFGLRTWF